MYYITIENKETKLKTYSNWDCIFICAKHFLELAFIGKLEIMDKQPGDMMRAENEKISVIITKTI